MLLSWGMSRKRQAEPLTEQLSLWKPASTAMLSNWTLFKVFREAGLPGGLFRMCVFVLVLGSRDTKQTTHSVQPQQQGCFRQELMNSERTGHRSLDGVRSYKRTSQEQRQALSDIVNLTTPQPKKQKMMSPHNPEAATCSQNTQQMGLAPAQISLQSCNNITFNINYGSV